MSTWIRDLAVGKKAELLFTQRFKALKPGSVFTFNNAKDLATLRQYDLLLNGKIRIEIKHDLKALTTGHVFVEYDCIAHSTSHYFAYQIGELFYGLKTNRLRELCNEQGLIYFSGLGKYAYLIPLETFLSNTETI